MVAAICRLAEVFDKSPARDSVSRELFYSKKDEEIEDREFAIASIPLLLDAVFMGLPNDLFELSKVLKMQ